jgi:hypothetical protein
VALVTICAHLLQVHDLILPRTVIILGLVSLLNDGASEMVTPLLPVFLTATLGAGPAVVISKAAEFVDVLKLISAADGPRLNPKRIVVMAIPFMGALLGPLG